MPIINIRPSEPLRVASRGVTPDELDAAIAGITVDTGNLTDGSVTNGKLGPASVTTDKLANNAVTGTKIAAGTIDHTKIADDEIWNNNIADSAVQEPQIANDAIIARHVSDAAIVHAALADDAVWGNNIAASAVNTTEIANAAVTTIKLAAGAVDHTKIADDEVWNNNIADSAVQEAQIAIGAVTTTKIATSGVQTTNIANSAVIGIKIATGAIDHTKIADDEIWANNIAASAVQSDAIANDAIINRHISAGAIDHTQIGNDEIWANNITASAVQSDAIANNAIIARHVSDGAIVHDALGPDAVWAVNIAPSAVTEAKLANEAVTNLKLADMAANTVKGRFDSAGQPQDVTTSQLRLAIGAMNDWYAMERPGEISSDYSTSIAGGDVALLPPIAPSLVVASDEGAAVKLTGDMTIGRRFKYPLEPSRLYRVRAAYKRSVNSVDPANDAVVVGVAWYGQTKGFTSPSTTVLDSRVDVTTGSGWIVIQKIVARAAGVDVDVVAPSAARFATPYLQVFGASPETLLLVMDFTDITDAGILSPDVSAVEARVTALELVDSGDRLDALEATSTSPEVARYKTRTAAESAAGSGGIGATVDVIEALNYAVDDDSLFAPYVRRAVEPSGGDYFAGSDGSWWEKNPHRYKADGFTSPRSIERRAADIINLEDCYAEVATRGNVTDDTDAFQVAIAAAAQINGGTILVPRLSLPRLIGEPLLITATRTVADAGTYPDMPVGPGNPDVRRRGSIRIVGPGTGVIGSIFEKTGDEAFYTPGVLRYVGTGGGLFDIVSTYNAHISGLLLENDSPTAEFITRVRSYASPAESACIVTFKDVIYSLHEPLALRSDGTRGAQHEQQDCKHVVHEDCVFLHGQDNSGNLIPCVRLGEDSGVTGALIGGASILAHFERCTFQGDIIFRWALDATFRNCEHYPRRPISSAATLGTGRFLFDGDKIVSGLNLDNVCSDGADMGVVDEIYMDCTGANIRNVRISGHYRIWDKTFILDGAGPFDFAATFNNTAAGAVDITIASTCTGQLFDRSDHKLTVGAGRTAVLDNRTPQATAVGGIPGYAAALGGQGMRWAVTSLADDGLFSFQPTGTNFFGCALMIAGNTELLNGLVFMRGHTSFNYANVVTQAAGGLIEAVDNTALTGTSGTDGKLSVSAVTNGFVYIENRTGAVVNLVLFVFR